MEQPFYKRNMESASLQTMDIPWADFGQGNMEALPISQEFDIFTTTLLDPLLQRPLETLQLHESTAYRTSKPSLSGVALSTDFGTDNKPSSENGPIGLNGYGCYPYKPLFSGQVSVVPPSILDGRTLSAPGPVSYGSPWILPYLGPVIDPFRSFPVDTQNLREIPVMPTVEEPAVSGSIEAGYYQDLHLSDTLTATDMMLSCA
ncbi:uncharacterized protein PG986_001183 [Apiospora aurea]|uniref:Uncharacterized protein n=1 Tax=Apiospora aurea TaxID=335848 RepID=A0ABR1QW35_9PEZI